MYCFFNVWSPCDTQHPPGWHANSICQISASCFDFTKRSALPIQPAPKLRLLPSLARRQLLPKPCLRWHNLGPSVHRTMTRMIRCPVLVVWDIALCPGRKRNLSLNPPRHRHFGSPERVGKQLSRKTAVTIAVQKGSNMVFYIESCLSLFISIPSLASFFLDFVCNWHMLARCFEDVCVWDSHFGGSDQ